MTEEAQGGDEFSKEAAFKAAMARQTEIAMARQKARDAEEAVQQEMWFQEWRKENRMKKFFQIAAWVIIVGGIIGFIVGHQIYTKNKAKIKSDEQAREVSAEQARKETTRKAIVELSDKHNAVTDLEEALNKIGHPYFTMEVEEMLLRKDNRPVLFFLSIKDIKRKGDKYLVHFNDYSTVEDVILECSDEQVRKVRQQKSESEKCGNYAVIAVINRINKVDFVVRASPDVEWKHDDEQPYPVGRIEVDTTDEFMATGSCVDLLFVGDYSYYDLHPVNIEELSK
jgi:hypothetical protein